MWWAIKLNNWLLFSFGRQSYLIFRVICVYFASKFDKNAYFEIKFYKTE